jgi:hypothetical protein
LPDNTQLSAVFIVSNIPKNDPPYFSPNLTNIIVLLQTSSIYYLTGIYDPENGPVTVPYVNLTGNTPLPSFITWPYSSSSTYIKINPVSAKTDVGIFNITVELSDGKNTPQFTFLVNVTNQPPRVNITVPCVIQVRFNQNSNYSLPSSYDPEGQPYFTQIV